MSCHTISYIISWHVMSYRIILYHISYHVIYHIIYHVMSSYISYIIYHIRSCHVIPYIISYIMSYIIYHISGHVIPYHIISYIISNEDAVKLAVDLNESFKLLAFLCLLLIKWRCQQLGLHSAESYDDKWIASRTGCGGKRSWPTVRCCLWT